MDLSKNCFYRQDFLSCLLYFYSVYELYIYPTCVYTTIEVSKCIAVQLVEDIKICKDADNY